MECDGLPLRKGSFQTLGYFRESSMHEIFVFGFCSQKTKVFQPEDDKLRFRTWNIFQNVVEIKLRIWKINVNHCSDCEILRIIDQHFFRLLDVRQPDDAAEEKCDQPQARHPNESLNEFSTTWVLTQK